MSGRYVTMILAAAGLMLAIFGGKWIVQGYSYYPVVGLAVVVIGVLGFIRPRIALGILVFSMLLSPEIIVARVPGRDVVMRVDDFLLVVMFFAWLARLAVRRELAVLIGTELHMPMFLYIVIGAVSLVYNGLTAGYNSLKGALYLLKYAEYFMLYVMVVNLVQTRRHIQLILFMAFLTSLAVTVYVYTTMAAGVYRTSAPFEAPIGQAQQGEPASLGGYYLVVFGVLAGMASQLPAVPALGLLAVFFVMLPPFAMTLSRASYVGVAAMAAAWVVFSGRRWLAALIVPGLALLFLFVWFPGIGEKITHRLEYTFTYDSGAPTETLEIGGVRRQVALDPSAQGRITFWRRAFFELLPASPFLGFGPGCARPVEGHVPFLISETGLLGLFTFSWILLRAFHKAFFTFRGSQDPLIRGVNAGMLLGLVGLLVQGIGVNTFIIVRIMEPLMLMMGLAMVTARLQEARPEDAVPAAGTGNMIP